MGKTISIYLTDNAEQSLNNYARKHNCSRSKAIDNLLQLGVKYANLIDLFSIREIADKRDWSYHKVVRVLITLGTKFYRRNQHGNTRKN